MTAPTTPGWSRGGDVIAGPRPDARRELVRRGADRRRILRLIVLVLVAVVALGAVIVLESPVLDVDEIDVAGARATDPAAVTEAAGITVGSPLLLADLDGAETDIRALPWVEDVTVERDLPGRVHVDVVERTPAALVANGATTVVVDADGRVLAGDPSAVPPAVDTSPDFVEVVADDALPEVGGVVGPALADAVALARRLRADPAGAVRAVHVEPLRFELADGAVVELGGVDGLEAKLEAFRTIHARVDRTCLATIDLRVPERPVLTREEPCS